MTSKKRMNEILYPSVSLEFSLKCRTCGDITTDSLSFFLAYEEVGSGYNTVRCGEIDHEIDDFVCSTCGGNVCEVAWPPEDLTTCECVGRFILTRNDNRYTELQCTRCKTIRKPLPEKDAEHIVWYTRSQVGNEYSSPDDYDFLVAINPDSPNDVVRDIADRYHAKEFQFSPPSQDKILVLGTAKHVQINCGYETREHD